MTARRIFLALGLVALPVACGQTKPGDDSAGESGGSTSSTGSTGSTGSSGTTDPTSTGGYEVPEGCAEFQFPEFEGPFGQLYCEVYIGCFGEVGGREPGDPKATTIEGCLQLTCGNGSVDFDEADNCSYDAALGQACLEAFGAIADDLAGKCPEEDDAWFPDACQLVIECPLGG